MILAIKPRLHEWEALASDNLALPLIFFNLLRWNLKIVPICEIFPADHLKAEKWFWRQFPHYLKHYIIIKTEYTLPPDRDLQFPVECTGESRDVWWYEALEMKGQYNI